MDRLTVVSGLLFLAADIFAFMSLAMPDWIVSYVGGQHSLMLTHTKCWISMTYDTKMHCSKFLVCCVDYYHNFYMWIWKLKILPMALNYWLDIFWFLFWICFILYFFPFRWNQTWIDVDLWNSIQQKTGGWIIRKCNVDFWLIQEVKNYSPKVGMDESGVGLG